MIPKQTKKRAQWRASISIITKGNFKVYTKKAINAGIRFLGHVVKCLELIMIRIIHAAYNMHMHTISYGPYAVYIKVQKISKNDLLCSESASFTRI